MSDSQGQIVTFYSFKGGTGRTMALANVAWILAANGKRVLVADWDLESPGLHRFFRPYLDPATIGQAGGVIDMIRKFEWVAEQSGSLPDNWHEEYARVLPYAMSINWRFPGGGTLDFLAAGRQNSDYAAALVGLDWDAFYYKRDGGKFFRALREDMKKNYEYTLIDSRTGLSDVADICTIHLPDTLVDCFTFSEQGIEGAAQVANTVAGKYKNKRIRILPVPMRVDQAEKDKAAAGQALAMRRFANLPADLVGDERLRYWTSVEVPYQPFYAYEETLATFGDLPGQPMLSAFEKLTGYITSGAITALPPMDDAVRQLEKDKFRRRVATSDTEIVLWSAPEDDVWAEWISGLLLSVGIRASDATKPVPPGVRTMAILSGSSAAAGIPQTVHNGADSCLAVYVADIKSTIDAIPLERSALVANTPESVAADRILKLLGRLPTSEPNSARYPGPEPVNFNALARNQLFTGRDTEIRAIREQLRSRGGALVLLASSGYGKTQIALEYAYRYRKAYDLIWWITAEQSNVADTGLSDLAVRLGLSKGLTAVESTQNLLTTLSRGEPTERWLLIYDSADDVDRVSKLLPPGNRGHVLITSRDAAWRATHHVMEINVFQREESVAHLRRRLETITEAEATHIANVFEDLPFAISASGAYLTDTATPMPDYLQQIDSGSYGIDAAFEQWRRSADTLAVQSPGAHRLLQLCSVMAGEISRELINSDEMADALYPFDPAVSTRDGRGRLVQNLNRLALIKLDTARGQIHLHRLLRQVIRERMTPEELEQTKHEVHLILAASSPRGEVDDSATWRRFRLLWPHIVESEADRCEDEKVCKLLIDRVRFLNLQGDHDQGAQLGAELVELWSSRLAQGPQDRSRLIQLLEMRFNLANILRSMGRFGEALAIDEDVLAQQQAIGVDNLDVLRTSGSLAADLRGLGRYAEALQMDKVTYPAYVHELGEDNERTLRAANNLATAYRLMGNYQDALRLDESIYAKRQAADPNNLYTHAAASNLGRDQREAGEYERSANLLRLVYEQICDARGSETNEALLAQANLAVSLRANGRADEAMALLDSAFANLTALRGQSNPDSLACRLSHAANLLAVERYAEADEEMSAVVASYQRLFGPEHPHALAAMSNRSATLRALGRREEARDQAERAADLLSSVLSPDHPFAIGARMNQAVCLAELGELDEARLLTERAHEALARTLGADHPDTLRAAANLALILRAKEESDATAAQADQAIKRLARRLSDLHPTVRAMQEGKYAHRIIEPHPF